MGNLLKYYRRNRKKAVIIVLIILVSAFCITFVQTLVRSVYATAKTAAITPLEHFSIASYTGKDRETGAEELRALEAYGESFPAAQSATSIKTAFGTSSSYVFFTDDRAVIADIMERCGLRMTAGSVEEE